MAKNQTTLTEEVEKILAPAIDVRAPYAKVMVAEIVRLKVAEQVDEHVRLHLNLGSRSHPQPDNPTLPKLLRAIAGGSDARESNIFNLAADKCISYDTLKQAVLDYLSETDNPVPDYTQRLNLRNYLRLLTGAPPAPKRRD